MVPGKLQVLLLDDEVAFTETLGMVLTEYGCEVCECSNAVDALARCRECAYQLILMDLHMPRMSGTQVLRCLAETGQPARVVVATGYTDPQLEKDLLRAGVSCVLHKPVDPADVLRIVDSIRLPGKEESEPIPANNS